MCYRSFNKQIKGELPMNISHCNRRRKALFVSNVPVDVKFFITVLGGMHVYIIARDGQNALVRANSQSPDFILIDFEIPGIDACQLIQRLKAHERTNDIPLIVFNGKNCLSTRNMVFALGVSAYITRPLDTKYLLQAVEKIFNHHKGSP